MNYFSSSDKIKPQNFLRISNIDWKFQEARANSSLGSNEDISSSENGAIEDQTIDGEQSICPKEEITQKLKVWILTFILSL